MGLSNIDQGTLYWKCYNPRPACPNMRVAQVSDADVRWVSPVEVNLPQCAGCGEIRTLKVIFDDQELQADNLITYGMIPEQQWLPNALTGEQTPVMIPAFKPIGANPLHARNRALATQLAAIGKSYVPDPGTP